MVDRLVQLIGLAGEPCRRFIRVGGLKAVLQPRQFDAQRRRKFGIGGEDRVVSEGLAGDTAADHLSDDGLDVGG